jgi:putative colanic acid biosynthesis UDP-glucose lipid carrier transferase
MHAKWTEINGVPIISVFDTPLSGKTAQLIKRTEDIILSIIILIMISPVLIAVALGVKLSSPGPVLFKQNRYGINGQPINVYKFRSMTSQDNGNIIKQATKKDIRITAFGAFIRKTSLDELPQFYNVIQGRMSIVGPRPHAVAHNEEYRKLIPKYMQRHLVKPGITGWAQINGWRGETDTLHKMKKRIDFDLHYINTWSLWLDIKIIILTTVKGFINKNAY